MKAGPAAIVLSVCLLLHALWAALEPITAADLWWTMAAGRWIAAHGTVPAVDVFSYTFAGAPWFNQEWLSQVAFYELYRVAGGTALAVDAQNLYGKVAAIGIAEPMRSYVTRSLARLAS